MTNDDQIKKSIRRNANRKSRTNDIPVTANRDAGSFRILCLLLNAPQTSKFILLAMLIFGGTGYKIASGLADADLIGSVGYGLLTAIVIASLYALYLWSWYSGYKKFMREKSLEEWDRFIATRSNSFLKDKSFVKIMVSIKMTPLANADHHKSIEEFMKQWQAEGDSVYSGSKWTGVRPDNFKVHGKSVSGHISISNGMKLVLKKLMTDLPDLVTRVGKEHFTTSMSWSSEVIFNEDGSKDSIDQAIEDERFRRSAESES
ncbi:MAG: hypothetical protein C0523_09915 [Cytophaga sp.]|nr:hypothetical protein [Cytophaga sp.]